MSEAMKTSGAEIASGKQDSSEGIRVTDDIVRYVYLYGCEKLRPCFPHKKMR